MEVRINHKARMYGDGLHDAELLMIKALEENGAALTDKAQWLNDAHKAFYVLSNVHLLETLDDVRKVTVYNDGYRLDAGLIKTEQFPDFSSVQLGAEEELACYNWMGLLYDHVLRSEYYGSGIKAEAMTDKLGNAYEGFKWVTGADKGEGQGWRGIATATAAMSFAKPWCKKHFNLTSAEADGFEVYSKSNKYRQYSNEYDSSAVTVTPETKITDREGYFKEELDDLVRGFMFNLRVGGELRDVMAAGWQDILRNRWDVTPVYANTTLIVVKQPKGLTLDGELTLTLGDWSSKAPAWCRMKMNDWT